MGASRGQLERENSNKLQRERDPALLFNSHLSVYKSSLYMQPWESCDNLTSICWLQAAVRVLQHTLLTMFPEIDQWAANWAEQQVEGICNASHRSFVLMIIIMIHFY